MVEACTPEVMKTSVLPMVLTIEQNPVANMQIHVYREQVCVCVFRLGDETRSCEHSSYLVMMVRSIVSVNSSSLSNVVWLEDLSTAASFS